MAGNMKQHVATVHLKLTPHHCDECSYKCAEAGNMRNHVAHVHRLLPRKPRKPKKTTATAAASKKATKAPNRKRKLSSSSTSEPTPLSSKPSSNKRRAAATSSSSSSSSSLLLLHLSQAQAGARTGLDELQAEDVARLVTLVSDLARGADLREPHESAQRLGFSFDVEDGEDASAAAAASVLVRELKERAGQVGQSEQALYFNVFSNIHAMLANVFEKQHSDEVVGSLRALVRVEAAAMPILQHVWHYCWPQAAQDPALDAEVAKLLGPLVERFGRQMSLADITTLAGCVALEDLGGPKVAWRAGRAEARDFVSAKRVFSAQEQVALTLLPAWGSPARFDFAQAHFAALLAAAEEPGAPDLPPSFRPFVELYAVDADRFRQDFAFAFCKLLECKFRFEPAQPSGAQAKDRVKLLLGVDLQGDMAVFGFAEAKALPNTDQWRRAATLRSQRGAVLDRVRALTRASLAPPSPESPLAESPLAESEGGAGADAQAAALAKPTARANGNVNGNVNGNSNGVESANSKVELQPNTESATETATAGGASAGGASASGASAGGAGGRVSLDVFRAPHPATPANFAFSLGDPADRAAALAAHSVDANLTKFKPSLVPRISEVSFYSNYMSHVLQLRKALGEPSRPREVRVCVGSGNPVKLNAVKQAVADAFGEPADRRFFFEALADCPSGVAEQPMGDDETRVGALNRAAHCHRERPGGFSVGIEGGLEDKDGLQCFAWVAVIAPNGQTNATRTASFSVPPALAALVRKGLELGRADDIVHGTTNAKQGAGTVGKLTGGVIDRTAYYAHAATLCFAPFAFPNLHI